MRSLTFSKDKKYGIIIDFMDKGKFLSDHSKTRQKQYNKIKGFKIKNKKIKKDFYKE